MEPEVLSRSMTILIAMATINMTLLLLLVIVAFRASMQLERIETTVSQTNRMLGAWATTWGQDSASVQKSLLQAMTGVSEDGTTS
jgi:hypothetical protein